MNVWLIGMMGAGKTAAGRLAAESLGYRFVDTDDLIESESGFSIADLFEYEGERGFRARETELIQRLAAEDGAVIATGGGAVLDAENRRLMNASGTVIWLDASPETLINRLDRDPKVRPLARNPAALRQIHAARYGVYQGTAAHRVDTDGVDPEGVAGEIVALL